MSSQTSPRRHLYNVDIYNIDPSVSWTVHMVPDCTIGSMRQTKTLSHFLPCDISFFEKGKQKRHSTPIANRKRI